MAGKADAPALGGMALAALGLAVLEGVAGGGASPTLIGALALAGLSGAASGVVARRAASTDVGSLRADPPTLGVRLGLDANGDVAEAAGPARSLMGLAPELLLGCGFFDRLHVVDRVAFMRALGDMRGGAERRRIELRVRLPLDATDGVDGFSGFLLELWRSGDPRAPFTGELRDNDEVTRLRGALDQARAEAGRAEAERGRLLAGLAHELRTPLTAILGFSDILGQGAFGGFTDRRQEEYVGLIRQSGQHLLAVIDSMAQVATLEAGAAALDLETFRLADAVETCRAMLAMTAEAKRVTIATEISASFGTIRADRRTVQQILLILLSNAVKFTPAGGRVTVVARRVGSRLHVTVSDTGCGIAARDIGRLGRPFVQVGENAGSGQGSGLGLSLAKELAARHGGTLDIESAPGEGTVVSVSLAADGAVERSSSQGKAAAWRNGEKETAHGALRKTA